MPRAAVAAQAAAALDVVLHLRRHRGVRHLAQVAAVGLAASGELEVRTVATWDGPGGGDPVPGPGWKNLWGRWGPC
jgi:pilus assembly protein CpaF